MPKAKGGKRNQTGQIEEAARQLVLPLIENAGYKLWDVIFEKEGAMWYLRILFDKEDGITTDECEQMTEPINVLMDKQSFIESVDILEVGSPGLTAKLRSEEHFRASFGKAVRITMKDPNGKEIYKYGTLTDYNPESDEITVDGEIIKVKKTIKINLDCDFGGKTNE